MVVKKPVIRLFWLLSNFLTLDYTALEITNLDLTIDLIYNTLAIVLITKLKVLTFTKTFRQLLLNNWVLKIFLLDLLVISSTSFTIVYFEQKNK